MNQAVKKRILLSPELIEAQEGFFFKNAGFELCSEYDPATDYEFIIDDYMPELVSLPRLQLKDTLPLQFQSQVKGYIDNTFFNLEDAKKLLLNYYTGFSDFNLVDHYSSQFKNVYTMKIQDYLNIGFFIDTIVVEAYKQKFDLDKIRAYLNFAIPLALKTVEQQEIPVHLDVSFSYSEEAFAVQISFQAGDTEFKHDLATIKKFSDHTNFYDLVYFRRRERLSFSAAWFKNPQLQSAKAYFFNEVISKKLNEGSFGLETVEGPDQSIVYTARKLASDQLNRLQLVLALSLFIKDLRDNEESPIDASSLVISDIDDYLTKYPWQNELKDLDEDLKSFIIKLLGDDESFRETAEYVEQTANGNLDNHIDEILRVLGQKSLQEMNDFLRVKGSKEDGEGNVKLSGWAENLNEETWKVKRSEILDRINDEISIIKSQGRNIVEADILRVISGQLQERPENLKRFVEKLIREALCAEAMTKQKLQDVFSDMLVTPRVAPIHDPEKERLEHQLERMRKLMLQMKNEMIKLRKRVQVSNAPFSDSHDEEMTKLKRALDKAIEFGKNESKKTEKLNADLENIVQAKNHKIATLEMRIETIKSEFAESTTFANEETIEKLQVENKSLLARLELANRKINILNENMNKQDYQLDDKKDIEIVSLKSELQTAQDLIDQIKSEKAALEYRLRDNSPDNAIEKASDQEILLSSLTTEKRSLEEKLRVQRMELKKVEQKLKFAVAQLEESQRKKGTTSGSGQKSNEAYTKQLESLNHRLAEACNEITEKRKELHKLKQDNKILSLRITELEKKLLNVEKKAS